ncbi:unnamed protein product [Hymenolepis diminuta]|uniref:Uncharacterized protein n=1 Tax=Hymenolepis diminuta TaxID=6216 RepID=A0A564YY88_HYMDI|nr:unnamed protein product [Hymenolepis diminuta]
MIITNDKVPLEDIANECINSNINRDSGMNQQSSDEHNYVNRISSENASGNAATPREPLTESWLSNEFHFVHINPTNTNCETIVDIKKQCAEEYQNLERTSSRSVNQKSFK